MTFSPAAGSALLTGFSLSLTLIVAIGAQNAFVLRQGLRREHVGAVVLCCAVADALLMAAGVAGLAQVLGRAPLLTSLLTAFGAVFLAVYGWRALRRARQVQALSVAAPSAAPAALGAVLMQAAAFTFLNPHVYLDTVLLVGSVGAQAGAQAPWFLLGACTASVLWFTALGYGARALAPVFAKPRAWQVLDTVVGCTMLLLAALLVLSLL
jgi:L-lysine exporter family protein LysE/ArgO